MRLAHIITMAVCVMAATIWCGSAAFADDRGPCFRVIDACKMTWFSADADLQGGKNLYVDCLGALKAGKAVSNVPVDAADIQACFFPQDNSEHVSQDVADKATYEPPE